VNDAGETWGAGVKIQKNKKNFVPLFEKSQSRIQCEGFIVWTVAAIVVVVVAAKCEALRA